MIIVNVIHKLAFVIYNIKFIENKICFFKNYYFMSTINII